MRSKRLELMDQISAYIDQYYCERQTTPSVNEVALGVGVSKATAYRYLVAMDERGMLEYDGSSRTIVTKLGNRGGEYCRVCQPACFPFRAW